MNEVKYATVRNMNWLIHQHDDGTYPTEYATLALLMDIRSELKLLRSIFECPNFSDVPTKLDRIVTNTRQRRRRKKVAS